MTRNQILHGDARELAKTLPDDSVHCIVTSPPYFGLRDYGVDGQIGLEQSPDEYVAEMVALFRELRRALHPSGTCWLNLGDSYASGTKGSGGGWALDPSNYAYKAQAYGARQFNSGGLADKQLLGIPWRTSLALQADEWWLRSDIIWHKKSPMPESVTDRPTKAHEYLFLLSKSPQYFYDADAVREPHKDASLSRYEYGHNAPPDSTGMVSAASVTGAFQSKRMGDHVNPNGANKRTVWTLGPEPYAAAHFATFPKALVRPCILAGTSAKGVCPKCLAPWERVVEREVQTNGAGRKHIAGHEAPWMNGWEGIPRGTVATITTGWQPTCSCDAGDPIPAVVLDPFMGSGTTGAVAIETGRDWLGFELNAEYIKLAERRIYGAQPALFAQGEYA